MPANSTPRSTPDSPENDGENTPEYVVQATEISKERDADVILFNGPVSRPNAFKLIRACHGRIKRKNVFLLLTTLGGDPHAAYVIARHLQANHERFTLFVSGLCKSAGTLIALGAHELIISSYGELGPLDVQLSKKDELGETQSGLVGLDALTQLQRLAFDSFEEFFLTMKIRSGLTAQTCAKIATDLTSGLFTPIYGQIDPLHLGETGRAMSIAWNYGLRLIRDEKKRNISPNDVTRLVNDYPSHAFVIDMAEIQELFKNVGEPNTAEQGLADSLGDLAVIPTDSRNALIEIFPRENENI